MVSFEEVFLERVTLRNCCYSLVAKLWDSLRPCGLQPTRLLCPWGFPGKSTEVGCHFFLHRILSTQESNLSLLPWQADCLPLSHLGNPLIRINWIKGKDGQNTDWELIMFLRRWKENNFFKLKLKCIYYTCQTFRDSIICNLAYYLKQCMWHCIHHEFLN